MRSFKELTETAFLATPVAFGSRATHSVRSDIVLHLPVLEYFASRCKHVTEFGVRYGYSTITFLNGCLDGGTVVSCDIEKTPIVDELRSADLPSRWEFLQMDTGDLDAASRVGPTDLLFVDTLHTYEHVRKELALHGRKATKYLIFHDTFTCGERDLSGPDPNAVGILPAIREFVRMHLDYYVVYATDRNNGLLVLERWS